MLDKALLDEKVIHRFLDQYSRENVIKVEDQKQIPEIKLSVQVVEPTNNNERVSIKLVCDFMCLNAILLYNNVFINRMWM